MNYLRNKLPQYLNCIKNKKIFLYLLILFSLNSCHVGRFVYWNFADADDFKKFKSVDISTVKNPNPLSSVANNTVFKKPLYKKNSSEKLSFDDVLKKSKTNAFVVLKDGKVLYEHYLNKHSKNQIHTSFSVSKSFVSALLGIAIEEGYINSIHDKAKKYLPLLDDSLNDITLFDFINMQSGVRFSEGYFNPFGHVAKFYYGLDLKKYVGNLKKGRPAGEKWKYISGNTQIIGMVIEAATKKPLNVYLKEKIWMPLAMENDASWNIDDPKNNTIKSFCCLNATARDFAKFGQLYINKGVWEGKQILPEKWVEETTSFNNSVNKYVYSHFWWRSISFQDLREIMEDRKEISPAISPETDFQAVGILGQYIYVNPKNNMVIVRLGDKFGKINWSRFFKDIVALNKAE